MRLEYRIDETGDILYFFENIPEFEMRARRMCLFYILDGKVYEVLCTRMEEKEEKNIFVIYLQQVNDEYAYPPKEGETEKNQQNVSVEFREFIDEELESPFLTKWEDVLEHEYIFDAVMASDQVKIKNAWYSIKTREMDEDRKIYVVYVQRTYEKV